MITSLRKRHRFIWSLWAILLPLGFIAALMVIPDFPHQSLVDKSLPDAYETIVREIDGEDYKVNIRKDQAEHYQLELFLKEPVQSPAPTLYLSPDGSNQLEGSIFVANIGGTGLYRFPLEKSKLADAQGIFFHCNVAEHVVKTIPFSKTSKSN